MSLIDDLRERLSRDNLSLRDAAKLCGVSFSTLSRLLRGSGEESMQTHRSLAAWLYNEPLPPKDAKIIFVRYVTVGPLKLKLTGEVVK